MLAGTAGVTLGAEAAGGGWCGLLIMADGFGEWLSRRVANSGRMCSTGWEGLSIIITFNVSKGRESGGGIR